MIEELTAKHEAEVRQWVALTLFQKNGICVCDFMVHVRTAQLLTTTSWPTHWLYVTVGFLIVSRRWYEVDMDEGSADSIRRITHFVLDSILCNRYLSVIQLHNIYYSGDEPHSIPHWIYSTPRILPVFSLRGVPLTLTHILCMYLTCILDCVYRWWHTLRSERSYWLVKRGTSPLICRGWGSCRGRTVR